MKDTNSLIIGASISGLACAATLKKGNIEYIIVEKESQVAAPWHKHYERLHLHTSRRLSHLPFKKFGKSIPRYPTRQQVVDYCNEYQKEFGINPFFNTEALSVKKKDGYWITETHQGPFRSKYVIMATGAYGKPRPIHFKGIETFGGRVLHSCDYKTGKDFRGQRVLVVGFGNSACEIALDLYEQGAVPSMSVRSPVNVVPRDVLGIPVLELSWLLSPLPPRLADRLSAPLMRLLMGDLTRLGLKKMPYGPLEGICRDGKPPVLDIGTIQHIREGKIKIYDEIDRIDGQTVYFKDGKHAIFDVVVAAIGYYRDYTGWVDVDVSRFADLQVAADKQKYFGQDGLYFCGYWISPTGQIHEIAKDAQKIAGDIARKEQR